MCDLWSLNFDPLMKCLHFYIIEYLLKKKKLLFLDTAPIKSAFDGAKYYSKHALFSIRFL